MWRNSRRLFCTATPELPPKAKCSVAARFRSFFFGAVCASAVGMYVIAFQLQGLLDEVRSAVHDVALRQQMIEHKLENKLEHKLEQNLE